jgi:hypothetical protein
MRLLVVMVLKRVVRAVMAAGYIIRPTRSGLSRGVQIDLLIDAMVHLEHEPTKRSILAGENATIQCSGEKKSLQQDRETFSKNVPLTKFVVSLS